MVSNSNSTVNKIAHQFALYIGASPPATLATILRIRRNYHNGMSATCTISQLILYIGAIAPANIHTDTLVSELCRAARCTNTHPRFIQLYTSLCAPDIRHIDTLYDILTITEHAMRATTHVIFAHHTSPRGAYTDAWQFAISHITRIYSILNILSTQTLGDHCARIYTALHDIMDTLCRYSRECTDGAGYA
jgi:hypothetical protein